MKPKELLLDYLKKAANHHDAMAGTEDKISKVHATAAESHTDAVLAQHHRDLADYHGARAQHHNDHSRHLLQMHEHVSGISAAELFSSRSDAGDELMDATSGTSLLKRFVSREAA